MLPNSFVVLQKLQELNLKASGIQSLPESFGELENLKMLDLSYCEELKMLPDSVRDLKNLQKVDLHRSGVESLSESFGVLHSSPGFWTRVLRFFVD